MKKLSLFLSLIIAVNCFSQDYTWVRGSNASGATGTYGFMGFPATGNDPGGRHGAATWVDNSGNLWLFGGEGYSSTSALCWLNDLWKYDITTNQWTWIKGSNLPNQLANYGTQGMAAPTNDPGGREFTMSWVDQLGRFWLFGGDAYVGVPAPGRMGDLWMYDPATNMWTWMKGFNTPDQNGVYGTLGTSAPTNAPGSRNGAATWVDVNGDLWMWGGRGFDATGPSGFLNDLWKYSVLSNEWTWVNGSNTSGMNGTYGNLSVPASTNVPGGRELPAFWTDAVGYMYLFGGRGHAASGGPGYLNDLWRYNPFNNEWTWVKGSNVTNQLSVHGTQGSQSGSTTPGGRLGSASWTDAYGNLWLFGGEGWASAGLAELNDLFMYDLCANIWIWMKGATVHSQHGTYGTAGVPAPGNTPGARMFCTWWKEAHDNLWMIGGEGYDISSVNPDHMNDLWKYTPPVDPDTISAPGGNAFCSGNTATLSFPIGSALWFDAPSATPPIHIGNTYTTAPLTAISSASVYTFYAATCFYVPRSAINITVNPLPQMTIIGPDTVCTGNILTYTCIGTANSYTWTTGSTISTATISPVIPAYTFFVLGTDANGCNNSTSKSIVIYQAPSLTLTPSHTTLCANETATLSASGANSYSWSTTQPGSSIIVFPATTTLYTVTGKSTQGCANSASFSLVVDPCTGISQHGDMKPDYILCPNPNNGVFNLKLDSKTQNFKLFIFNSLGQKVIEQAVESSESQIEVNLPKGLYDCRIYINGIAYGTRKLIIQ